MVVIHLARGGRKGAPVYKIMVQEKGSKLRGRFLEKIGTYQPTNTKIPLLIKPERLTEWVSKGAVVSPRLAKIYKDYLKANPEALAASAPAATEKTAKKAAAPKAAKPAAKAAPKSKK